MSVNLTFVRLVLYSLINCLTQLTMKLAHHGHFPVCMAVSVLYVHPWWKWLTLEKNKSRTMYFSSLIWNKCHYPWEGERMGKARHHRWKEYSFVWWYVIPFITKQCTLAPLCINLIPLGFVSFALFHSVHFRFCPSHECSHFTNWFLFLKRVSQ